jgi:hypothetical protein
VFRRRTKTNDCLLYLDHIEVFVYTGEGGARPLREMLSVHKLVYYQSYHQWVIQDFIAAMNMRRAQRRSLRSKPRSNWQSTRLSWYDTNYTFWCSSVHNLELYCLIVEKYPAKSNYRRWMGGTAFAFCILGGCSK